MSTLDILLYIVIMVFQLNKKEMKMNKVNKEVTALMQYGRALHAMPSAIAFNASVNYGATKFKFANFKAVRDAVLPVFAEYNLAVRWTSKKVEDGLYLVGEVFYSDGEVVNTFSLPLRTEIKNQDMGSDLTYFKRYALSALANVVTDEDDDGNFADKAEAARGISGEQVKALKQTNRHF